MRVAYSPQYVAELPPEHPFPMRKFSALHEILLREALIRPEDVIEPEPAPWEALALGHTRRYLDALRLGTLTRDEVRRLGVPWTPAVVHRSRLAAQGTYDVTTHALRDGLAANLSGGTHHALPDSGEGFCVINDLGTTVRRRRHEGWRGRVLVIDLDVHQGNGNAVFFADDPLTYTFSMHGARNFPLRKPPSDRDVGLADHTGDAVYLGLLARHLPEVVDAARPDLVYYLHGVDVMTGDRYGRLSLSRSGLRERDRLVIETIRARGVPLVLLLAGGYAATPELTADLHAEAHRAAHRFERETTAGSPPARGAAGAAT